MYFENLKGEERKIYMEEKNLKDFNINEMTTTQFREFSKDTQFKIISELVEKYKTDAEISRHIKIGRCMIGNLRRELGIASNKSGGSYRSIKKQNTSPKKTPTFEKPQEKPQKENLIEIKITLVKCNGTDLQKKLESVGLFLEDSKKYDVEFVLKERVNN